VWSDLFGNTGTLDDLDAARKTIERFDRPLSVKAAGADGQVPSIEQRVAALEGNPPRE
jgi:hypothetical protein